MLEKPKPVDAEGVNETRAADVIERAVQDWARERPDLDVTPMEVFARLGRTYRLATAAIEKSLSEFDLTVSAMDVIFALRRAGEPYRRTPSELAEVSLLTSGGITFRLDKLEDSGLIRRIPSSEDRRVVWAELTAAGLALADRVVVAHLENESRLLANLSESDCDFLRGVLRRLEASIQAETGGSAVPTPRSGNSTSDM